ncbi:Response regulator PleD [BD1-7 clade bacterium]|uniref:diguanylate cyclase n=1 Tax=BD1-7 clade bacterium TaxID=2029982 RepID=A0A5S9Q9Q4_9GAMM|nr:Response regulator PleD [BD1-7 clade bacterium]
MHHYLGLHKQKLAIMLVATIASAIFYALVFDLKVFTSRGLVDVIGEGGTAACLLTWIVVFLWVRPSGRVTSLIFTGLMLIYFATLQDLLDEFFVIDQYKRFLTFAESVPSTVGMLILTYGFLHWKSEQESFNLSRLRTEKNLREHMAFDHITELYDAPYFEERFGQLLKHPEPMDVSLLLLDIEGYEDFLHQHGRPAANRLLRDAGALMAMSIRDQDLVCRYASDRFAVLLPQASTEIALQIGEDIQQSLSLCRYKVGTQRQMLDSIWISTTIHTQDAHGSVRQILKEANQQLTHKHRARVMVSDTVVA